MGLHLYLLEVKPIYISGSANLTCAGKVGWNACALYSARLGIATTLPQEASSLPHGKAVAVQKGLLSVDPNYLPLSSLPPQVRPSIPCPGMLSSHLCFTIPLLSPHPALACKGHWNWPGLWMHRPVQGVCDGISLLFLVQTSLMT